MKKITDLLIMICCFLLLTACGSQDGASGADGDAGTPAEVTGESLTLSSSLQQGEQLSQQGEISIYADVTNDEGLPVEDGFPVFFESSNGRITERANTVGGRATATFRAINQGGNVTINASDGLLLVDLTDELVLTVASGPAVQIVTESITPNQIGLRGSGQNEIATFNFSVTDGTGGPVQDGQIVNFSLESPTGGAEFISAESVSTVDGAVSVSLISGTVPGVATVTATTESEFGTITSQARITMGNSKADQLHLGFAVERRNIPGLITFGLTDQITAFIADRYSNPVSIDTPVFFASECGIVSLTDEAGEATNLINRFGQATATAVTGAPTAELCRYIYYTEGQESYTDSNGNGRYDVGEPHTDVGEPYIDANDSGTFDANELYFDLDENGVYTDVDGVWQGDTFVWTSTKIRWSAQTDTPQIEPSSFSLTRGVPKTFTVTATDVNGNPMPSGTTITVSPEEGTCEAVTLSGQVAGDGLVLPDAVNNQTEFSVTAFATAESTAGPCNLIVEVAGAEEDLNGTVSTTATGEILVSDGDGGGSDGGEIASFTGQGSDVKGPFTISEIGTYRFNMAVEGDGFASFDLNNEFGEREDGLSFVSGDSQAVDSVRLNPGRYFIEVDGTGSWSIDVSRL